MRRALLMFIAAAIFAGGAACRTKGGEATRASGYIEATEVRVAAEIGGRLLEMTGEEGRRVAPGDVIARVDTSDLEITLRKAAADRDHALALLRLIQAGARGEDIAQARAQADSARADIAAADAERQAASDDLRRFEALLASNAGSRKQRDDAAARDAAATARVTAARERARGAEEVVARLRAGPRREEVAVADARLAGANAQIAALQKNVADAVIKAPVSGTITAKLVDAGEVVPPRAAVAIISDLDHAWANVYVGEPVVPLLRLGQPVTLVTDAGQRLVGTITYISPRAEFTPRNVQTADERSKLVYRIKITVDNRQGVLKPGMPVEAELGKA